MQDLHKLLLANEYILKFINNQLTYSYHLLF